MPDNDLPKSNDDVKDTISRELLQTRADQHLNNNNRYGRLLNHDLIIYKAPPRPEDHSWTEIISSSSQPLAI